MNSWTTKLTKVIYYYPPHFWSSPSFISLALLLQLLYMCKGELWISTVNMISKDPVGFSDWYPSVSDRAFIQIISVQPQCHVLRLLPPFLFDSMVALTFAGKPVQRDGFWAWLLYALLAPNTVKLIAIFISSGREFCSLCRIASPVTTGFLIFPNGLIALCYVRLHFQREKELSHTARALQTCSILEMQSLFSDY